MLLVSRQFNQFLHCFVLTESVPVFIPKSLRYDQGAAVSPYHGNFIVINVQDQPFVFTRYHDTAVGNGYHLFFKVKPGYRNDVFLISD